MYGRYISGWWLSFPGKAQQAEAKHCGFAAPFLFLIVCGWLRTKITCKLRTVRVISLTGLTLHSISPLGCTDRRSRIKGMYLKELIAATTFTVCW